jgi:hypothetical protein
LCHKEVPGANSWEPPGRAASLLSGRKIDSTLKFARPFAHNTMSAKYLETQNHTRAAGSREALLREAAGIEKFDIIHRHWLRYRIELFVINAFIHIDKTIVKRYI